MSIEREYLNIIAITTKKGRAGQVSVNFSTTYGFKKLADKIQFVDAEGFKTRDAAMKALADLEGNARPALLEALKKNPSLETTRRINLLLADLTPELTLRNSRAVKAMELSGTAAARKLLEEWAAGSPGLYLTDESRAALKRLGQSQP